MLSVDERSELERTGVLRLPGAVARDVAGAMADRVWSFYERRGIRRDDATTWPAGFSGKNQGLRQAGVFEAFVPPTAELLDQLLGHGQWRETERWGPALVTFPQPGGWDLPHASWHFDLPGRGDPDRPRLARLFGFATDVDPEGGGTLVVEGTHELVRRMVRASPRRDAGSSAQLRKKLIARHPWFAALTKAGGDRVQQFMVDGDEIDGVRVRVAELTGRAGDVVTMLPWTMHAMSMNCAGTPRFMVTHNVYRHEGLDQNTEK